MIFTGHAEAKIDGKQRIAIPAKFRNVLKDESAWISLPWERKLMLYPASRFAELAEGFGNSLAPGGDEQELDTNLFGMAERLEMDATGRVILPTMHLEYAGLATDGSVAVVGAGKRIEVRDLAAWTASMQERFRSVPAMMRNLEERTKSKG